jgi:hypothetical protein
MVVAVALVSILAFACADPSPHTSKHICTARVQQTLRAAAPHVSQSKNQSLTKPYTQFRSCVTHQCELVGLCEPPVATGCEFTELYHASVVAAVVKQQGALRCGRFDHTPRIISALGLPLCSITACPKPLAPEPAAAAALCHFTHAPSPAVHFHHHACKTVKSLHDVHHVLTSDKHMTTRH